MGRPVQRAESRRQHVGCGSAIKYMRGSLLCPGVSAVHETSTDILIRAARVVLVMLVFSILSSARPDEFAVSTTSYFLPGETPVLNLIGWRMATGDSVQWGEADYDDSHWSWDPGFGLWAMNGESGRGVRWYRKTIVFPRVPDSLTTFALYQTAVVSAMEIYWDGACIARNGVVGVDSESEVPGRSGLLIPVPRNLSGVGKHVVAVRASNHHGFSGVIERPFCLGRFETLQTLLFRQGALSLFLAGFFVVSGLFHFAILFGRGNKWPYALFSAFCLSCALFILIRSTLEYFRVDLAYYYPLAAINDIPWLLMMVLLPVFFLYEFDAPLKRKASMVIAGAALTIVVLPRMVTFGIINPKFLPLLTAANQIHAYITVTLSIVVSVWALRSGRAGALTAAVGLTVFLVGMIASYVAGLENAWAVGFAVLIVVITISLSRQMAQRNRRAHEIELHSARLELDLLKKHIQPHFLLNSLNSIIAWLEEEPAVAAKLVDALAGELRMLLSFSGKKLISLREELALCEAHLKVMSLRQEKDYQLDTNIRTDSGIPPLVLHTLIENGLTHGYRGREKGYFSIEAEKTGDIVRILVFNDGSVSSGESGGSGGTGTRYVQSRLEEAFPSRWEFCGGPADGGWRVEIAYSEG